MTAKKLLVIHQGALGDFVVAFPGILKLKQKYSRIDVLCQEQLGRLAQFLDIAVQAYPLESAAFATLFSDSPEHRVRKLLKSYDAILLFSFSIELHNNLRRITVEPVYRIQPRPDPGIRRHVTRHIVDGLKEYGLINHTDVSGSFSLFLKNNKKNASENSRPDRILIHPGSGSLRKNWPLSLFIEVGNRLKSITMKPEYVIGPAENHLIDGLNRVGETVQRIDDLIVLSKELTASAAFLGNDSGVSHLSAFLGLPTVVLFGPSDPKRWAPMGSCVRIVGPENRALKCTPCFEKPDVSCKTRECMINISSNQVIKALLEVI